MDLIALFLLTLIFLATVGFFISAIRTTVARLDSKAKGSLDEAPLAAVEFEASASEQSRFRRRAAPTTERNLRFAYLVPVGTGAIILWFLLAK